MKKVSIYSMALLMGAISFTACSSDNDDNRDDNNTFNIVTTPPIVDQDNYSTNTTPVNYANKAFGELAIDGCTSLVSQLEAANAAIASAKLTETQETYLRKVLDNLVSSVIVPTYTKLADETEALEKALNGLTVNAITQAQINSACNDFKQARKYWEQSEAFLMGAASDFDVDPTIDSWPLNRSLLKSLSKCLKIIKSPSSTATSSSLTKPNSKPSSNTTTSPKSSPKPKHANSKKNIN